MNLRETLPRTTAAQKVAARTAILDFAGPAGAEEEEEEEEEEGAGGGGALAAASFSLTLSAREKEGGEPRCFLSRRSSQGSQTLPSTAQAVMCSSVSSSGLLNPKLDSSARFISRMPVLAAYQAATTKKVRTASRERKEAKEEEGEGGAKEVFVWRLRNEADADKDDGNGLPKNAATELTSEAEAAKGPTRAGDRGGGRKDDGDGFS